MLKKKRKREPRFYRVKLVASLAKYARKETLVHAVMRLVWKTFPEYEDIALL